MNESSSEQLINRDVVAAEEHVMSQLLELAIQPDALEDYLQKSIEMMLELVPYLKIVSTGGIFLTDNEAVPPRLRLVAGYHLPPAVQKKCAEIGLGECLCGSAVLDREVKFASSVCARKDINVDSIKAHEYLIVPILMEKGVLGVITLFLPEGYQKIETQVAFLQRVAGVIALGISNRYISKELHEAREKAEQGNIVKNEFMNKVSHELRTPLNGIIGLTQALECTDPDDEQEEIINALLISGKSLLALINDVLGYSDLNSGRFKITVSQFTLRDVFNSVESQIVNKVENKRQALSINIDSAMPQILTGDPFLLEKVLINLVNNAIKFSPPENDVNISAFVQKTDKDKVVLLFKVQDSGIGMTTQEQSRLFQQFDQVDNSTRRRYSGLGIGLVICKQLVQLMDGEIWVDSTVGEGSTFYFTVKLNQV